MTGYGQASSDLGQARVTVELRSLNHRYADIRLRLPAELAGSSQISIRAQSHHPMPYAYFSYNWFYNNTTP